MISINLESLFPLPTLLRGVTPAPARAGSEIALGGAMPSSSGAPLSLSACARPARPSASPRPSSPLTIPVIRPCLPVPAVAGAGVVSLRSLPSPGSSEATAGAPSLPASATSLMLALLSSLRLVMLPVPSGCRRFSLCPPRNPPGALPPPASEDLPPPAALLPPETDLARGLCSRDLSQFLTRLVGDSFADSGDVFEDGDKGEGSVLALLAEDGFVWILGVKGRIRCLCDGLSSTGRSGTPKGRSLSCSPGPVATAGDFRFSFSSRARRFSSALVAFSSSFLALASCLSWPLLAFSSSVGCYS